VVERPVAVEARELLGRDDRGRRGRVHLDDRDLALPVAVVVVGVRRRDDGVGGGVHPHGDQLVAVEHVQTGHQDAGARPAAHLLVGRLLDEQDAGLELYGRGLGDPADSHDTEACEDPDQRAGALGDE
jgi:hypothetical protein